MHAIQKLLCRVVALCLTALPLLAQVNIDPPTRSFTKDGGGGSILTSGTGSWTASTTASWLTITPRTTGTAGTSCIYVVAANLSADTRQGVIDVSGKSHTVTQTGYPVTLLPTLDTINLSGGVRTISLSTAAGVSWTASTSAPWITIGTPSGIGSGTVSYTVAAYSGVTTRTGSILIGSQTFSVSQTGTDVNIAPYSVQKAYSSDIVMVQVSALTTTTWSVTSNDSWISVVDAGNRFGDSTVTLGIGTNPSFLERTGTVTIGSATFTIRQSGTPNPIIDILPKTATCEPIGAYGNIAVVSTPDAPWTTESLSSWITLGSTQGQGNGNIGYVASANPTLSPRTGTVRVYAPVVLPAVDLTYSLLAHVPTGANDLSGWLHHLDGPIETRLDGSFRRELSGQDIKVDQDAGSLALRFRVENTGAVNRLAGINANSRNTALYVNAANRLVLHSDATLLVSDFVVEANKDYQVVVTASVAKEVKLYAGEVGGTIRLAGTATFPNAPFRLSVATPASAVKIGYADLPSAGYLNGGVLKDFRLYGRALNSDEATALFTAALSANPYGTVATPSIIPVASYNLRGQAAVTGGSLPPVTNTAKVYSVGTPGSLYSAGYVASPTNANTSQVAQKTFANVEVYRIYGLTAPFKTIDVPVSVTITPYYSGYYYYGGVAYVRAYLRITYTDATFTDLAAQTLTATKGSNNYFNVGSGSITANSTLSFTIPNQQKWVKSVTVFAGCGISAQYDPSYAPTASASIGTITTTVPAIAPSTISGLSGWSEANDRFSTAQRALQSNGAGELGLWSQQSSFSGDSATYSFWIRCEALPAAGAARQRLFSRGRWSESLLVELDSSGNLVVSDGTSTATIAAGIKIQQWQMITVAGAKGTNLTVYVDGAEVGNTNLFPAYNFGASGGDPVWQVFGGWSGSLGNVAFYNGALTSAQVMSIYTAERANFLDHVVTQGVVEPSLAPTTATLTATGGITSTQLTLAPNVTWSATSSAAWLEIKSGASGSGSTTLQVFAAANPTVTERTATVTIAGKVFTVTQAGQPATVVQPDTTFSTDGGSTWVDITAGGGAQWTATSNVSWLTVALGATGTGTGSAFIIADPYTDTSRSRTGTVTVAGRTLYFTQRGYALSITPQVAQIGSNAGAGQFGVAAPLSAIWEAIVTQPWITVTGSTTGIGNGTLRYTVAANTTGATRTGKIVVSGVEYTITQVANLILTTETDGNGTVSGGGSYQTGATASLTATPSSGYIFSHWTGDAVGSANPLSLNMDSGKTVKAYFIPQAAANTIATNSAAALGLVPASRVAEARSLTISEVTANPNAFGLYNRNQMQGLALGQPILERDPQTGKMSLNLGIKVSTDLQNWTNLGVATGDASVSGGKIKLSVTPNSNAMFYKLEGSAGN